MKHSNRKSPRRTMSKNWRHRSPSRSKSPIRIPSRIHKRSSTPYRSLSPIRIPSRSASPIRMPLRSPIHRPRRHANPFMYQLPLCRESRPLSRVRKTPYYPSMKYLF